MMDTPMPRCDFAAALVHDEYLILVCGGRAAAGAQVAIEPNSLEHGPLAFTAVFCEPAQLALALPELPFLAVRGFYIGDVVEPLIELVDASGRRRVPVLLPEEPLTLERMKQQDPELAQYFEDTLFPGCIIVDSIAWRSQEAQAR